MFSIPKTGILIKRNDDGKIDVIRDRRIFKRLPISTVVEYRTLKNPSSTEKSNCRDISGAGIGLVLNKKLEPGTLLELIIHYVDNSNSILTKGEVVWVSLKSEENQASYIVGVRFTEPKFLDIGIICEKYCNSTA